MAFKISYIMKWIFMIISWCMIIFCSLINPIMGSITHLPENRKSPNFIIFHADDLGNDLNIYGHPSTYTPNIDKLYMDGGIKFTQAITPDSVCTPNRMALLSAKYPIRSGFAHSYFRVMYDPTQPVLIPKNVTLFSTLLQGAGYDTSIYGKWHLGENLHTHNDSLALPLQYGFNHSYLVPFGMNPYMTPIAYPAVSTLYEDDILIQQPIYEGNFTTNMTDKIIKRINKNFKENKNFMMYVNYLQVHVPMFASEEFKGKTKRGPYGDDLFEMDSSIGQIVSHIKRLGLDDNTVFIFTSDNGAYGEEGINGGSSGLFKGFKGQTWDGGHRVPFIIRYKGMSNNNNAIYQSTISTMDIYPTVLDLAGIKYDKTSIDGLGIELEHIYQPLIRRNHQESTRILFHYCGERQLSIRYNDHKIHFYTPIWKDDQLQICTYLDDVEYGVCGCLNSDLEKHDVPLMYNIDEDPSEKYILTPENYDRYDVILANAWVALEKHQESIIPVVNQLAKPPHPELSPCCNFPSCCCNHHTCYNSTEVENLLIRGNEFREKMNKVQERYMKFNINKSKELRIEYHDFSKILNRIKDLINDIRK
jgi:arylsulfatase A